MLTLFPAKYAKLGRTLRPILRTSVRLVLPEHTRVLRPLRVSRALQGHMRLRGLRDVYHARNGAATLVPHAPTAQEDLAVNASTRPYGRS